MPGMACKLYSYDYTGIFNLFARLKFLFILHYNIFMKNISKYTYHILFFLIGVISLIYIMNVRWDNFKSNEWEITVSGDGVGYYEYLRAIFIHHDLSWSYMFSGQNHVPEVLSYHGYLNKLDNGTYVDKYTAGTAFLIMPFFLLGYLFSAVFGFELNGYSQISMVFLSISALFYLLLGLYFLKKILEFYGIRRFGIISILLVMVFGTNLFFYYTMVPAYSHVYTIAMLSAFIYYSIQVFHNFHHRYVILSALFLALAIFIRPTNIIVLMALPAISQNWKNFSSGLSNIFSSGKALIISIILLLAIPGIQLILYYLQTGHFLVWSYQGEGFNFSNPRILDVLFSYNKGMFLYIPLTFIAFAGAFIKIRSKTFERAGFLIFFVFIFYFFSCWSCWNTGASFGNRFLLDYYPFFAITLGFIFLEIEKRKLIYSAFTSLLIILLVFNQIQIYQYNHHILNHADMNKEAYFETFLKTSKRYYKITEKPKLDLSKVKDSLVVNTDFDHEISGDFQVKNLEIKKYENGSSSLMAYVTKATKFLFIDSLQNLNPENTMTFVKISFSAIAPDGLDHSSYVLTYVTDAKKVYSWDKQYIYQYISRIRHKSKTFEFIRTLPITDDGKGVFGVAVASEETPFYIDDFKLTFYNY